MSGKVKFVVLVSVAFSLASLVRGQDSVVNILSDELSREMDVLKAQTIAPYYI